MILLSMSFTACDSLGNTFLLYDLSEKSETFAHIIRTDPELPEAVTQLCTTHNTDGVLLLRRSGSEHKHLSVDIVNKDGSAGDLCLNGARCAAWYLWQTYRLPSRIALRMGNSIIDCQKRQDRVSLGVPPGVWDGQHKIEVQGNTFSGHIVDVGNPHFMVLSAANPVWLAENGRFFATHLYFPKGTNVEFVQKAGANEYFMQIYERGVGYCQACSSACIALMTLLYWQKQLPHSGTVNITMPGGQVQAHIDEFGLIQIEAEKPHLIASSNSN